MAYIELKNISKKSGEKTVISNFNLSIEKGEFVSLLGPSGCEKTTLLRMVAGFIDPTEGEIVIDGKTVFSAEKHIYVKTGKRNLDMVFQSYAVWPHMNVYENVAYPLKIKKLPKEVQREKTEAILKQVGLSGRARDYPWSLSGGQQQRVALARGLVMEPSVLLLDEPLSNLDVQLRQKMKEELMEIQRRTGVTVLYVTHDQSEALQMSHKIVVLSNGKTEQIGTPREIYHEPATVFTANFVGKMNLISLERGLIGVRPEYITVETPAKSCAVEEQAPSQLFRKFIDDSHQSQKSVDAAARNHSTQGILRKYVFEGNRNFYGFDTPCGVLTVKSAVELPLAAGKQAKLSWQREIVFEGAGKEMDA